MITAYKYEPKGSRLYHSGVEFIIGSRFAGRVSSPEIKGYSAKNNFSEVEHLTIANNIKKVFENSTFLAKRKGLKESDRANTLFFVNDVAIKNGDEIKQSRVLITLKESLDDKGKRVYSVELDIAPSNTKGGEVPNAKSENQSVNVELATNHTSSENLGKNSSANENKSQGENSRILDDKASENSRISGSKAGFSTPEIPAGALGGVGGHMAGNAIGAAAGEYESEGGIAGAIIGALAGLASPKAAAKIAAKMMSKKMGVEFSKSIDTKNVGA